MSVSWAEAVCPSIDGRSRGGRVNVPLRPIYCIASFRLCHVNLALDADVSPAICTTVWKQAGNTAVGPTCTMPPSTSSLPLMPVTDLPTMYGAVLTHYSPVIVTTMRRPLARSRCSHNHSPAIDERTVSESVQHSCLVHESHHCCCISRRCFH
jgi:hypothetical protein